MLDVEKALTMARDAWAKGDTLNDQVLEQVYASKKPLVDEQPMALVQAQYQRSIALSLLVLAEKFGR